MASTKYTYSIANDTANGEVAVSKLTSEIQQSAIVTALDYISVNGDVLDIWTKADLSSGDETILDSIVGSHDGVEEIIPQTVHLDVPYYNGKPSIRSESRAENTSSYFTTRGDSASDLGDGIRLEWDFSNSDNIITEHAPSNISIPTNFKRKRVDISFKDVVWIKEGTVYFYNAIKGSFVDLYVICPTGHYYMDRNGTPQQATEDTIVEHYVNGHPIQESAPMGDELNTEAAAINGAPAGYVFRVEVTVPDSDNNSNGYAELELYRSRSFLLPNESA
jgi:hypothetical protein